MKLKVREQMICWLFAVILFLTGMCVEIPPADPYFSYVQESSVNKVSVIRENINTIGVERICTPNMIGKTNVTYLSNKGRTQVKRFVRNVAILYIALSILCCISYFRRTTVCSGSKLVSSRAVIVRYIQQKDGKK